MKKLLVAFDFDHTIIDSNSDIVVRKMLPASSIPDKVKHLYRTDGWTCYMQEIFNLLHRHRISKQSILKECRSFQPAPGMLKLIYELKNSHAADIIVISDSNSIFIEEWLRSKDLQKHVEHVYTNPASWDEAERLEIEMYHEQDWCTLSTKNLCKGHILESYIKEKSAEENVYDVVAYVGDGRNDLCPTLTLRDVDHVFPRQGYQLVDLLNDAVANSTHSIKAQIHAWTSGLEILKVVEELCQ